MIMKILIVSEFAGQIVLKEVNVIPRQGDYIDIFYTPIPKVTKVILYPSPATLKQVDTEKRILNEIDYMFVDALVVLD
jgi:hypothetical protein